MHIRIVPDASKALPELLSDQETVIILDVLRATSTMLTALANGAASITAVRTVEQAHALRGAHTLLGGERHCQRIAGFDLGNSPLEYTKEIVAGRSIVMTTTNGTRAIEMTKKARYQLIGSLLNASACAEKAMQLGGDICIVCAGTRDQFALEDAMAAGLLTERLLHLAKQQQVAATTDDLALCLQAAYGQLKDTLAEVLLACDSGKRLAQLGYAEDVLYCAQIDAIQRVPIVIEGKVLNESPSHTMG